MAFFLNDRPRDILPRVIEALQRREDDPEQLARARDQEPPPPYESSAETTQPPTPRPPVVDEFQCRCEKVKAHNKSQPGIMFDSQTDREQERIKYQLLKCHSGRKQTLPFVQSMDFLANAQNNVRSRWIEQGVWMDDWGPAWPDDSHPLTTSWRYSGRHPARFPEPGARWGHEKQPEPEPDPAPDSDQKQPLASSRLAALFGAFKPEPPNAIGEDSANPSQPRIPEPPSARNPEASRPYHQFLYQISHEREWIKDELEHNSARAVDIDAMAYESVKKN